MPKLSNNLLLEKCPHCRIDNPNLTKKYDFATSNHEGQNKRNWFVYTCERCGGVVTASATSKGAEIIDHYPELPTVDKSLPGKSKEFLKQAHNTVHAPAGCIMLCASAVDAMLKEKGYKDGSLYNRIKDASSDNLITDEMEKWAHEVRLDANDQRHADDDAKLPKFQDAQRTIEFASALAEYLFVLPSKVNQGIKNTSN